MLLCLLAPLFLVSAYWINQPLQKRASGFSKRDVVPDTVESIPSRVVRLNKRDTLVPVVQIGADTTVVEVVCEGVGIVLTIDNDHNSGVKGDCGHHRRDCGKVC